MNAVLTKDEDLREKIKTFMVKLDRIENRVKEVEGVTAAIPRLEAKLQTVEHRVGVTENRLDKTHPMPSAPVRVKAFIGGATIGVIILAAIAIAWLTGLF